MEQRDVVFDVEFVDEHLDAILKASGSSLRNYSMQGTLTERAIQSVLM